MKPLCQTENAGCSACCGLYNFKDRSTKELQRRLTSRTEKIAPVLADKEKLAAVRDKILEDEKPDILYATIKVCPFAGYIEQDRVGCMIHPALHPSGEDWRDLAVHPKEVCQEHFCAPHSWLSEREKAFAQCATSIDYGLVVTDAGLVKTLLKELENRAARPLQIADFKTHQRTFAKLWKALLAWPFRDPDPHRFGGFLVLGDGEIERTIKMQNEALPATLKTIFDGLGTRILTQAEVSAACDHLDALLAPCLQKILSIEERPCAS